MLNTIGTAFKGLFTAIIGVALVSVVIVGFIFMSDSPLIGFLIIIGGTIFIVLSAGMVSIFINIGDDILDIKKMLETKYGNNNIQVIDNHVNKDLKLWICGSCGVTNDITNIVCTKCGRNIENQ